MTNTGDLMKQDVLGIKGRVSILVNGKVFHSQENTITYAGFQWFLRQSTGAYERPIQGVRIGNGGGANGAPLPNDPSLTDVRQPIIGTVLYPNQAYVEYMEPAPLNFSTTSPWTVIIDSLMNQAAYYDGNYPYSDKIVNEAGLWVPETDVLLTDGILVSYTVFKNASGSLVNVPIIEGAELLIRWELTVA